MLDRERVMIKLAELAGYLGELRQVVPAKFAEYQRIEKKRSCERLLQLAIECVIDVCKIMVVGLRLGIPYEENDLFAKLTKHKIISKRTLSILKEMRGLRNILVHEYADVDDEIIFEILRTRLGDFEHFSETIARAVQN